MIDGMSVLAVIPARGGSKGIPHKNIFPLAGKPLIAWTIEAAKQSRFIDRLILSSEDNEVIRIARQWGCEVPFTRPVQLAQDETPGMEPVFHALEQCPGFDRIVLLQPTSPCRIGLDIDNCLEEMHAHQARAAVSVSESRCHPAWTYRVETNGRMQPFLESAATRRQDLQPAYCLNGAVYVAACEWLIKNRSFIGDGTVAYEMPKERSVDIDDMLDIAIAGILLAQRGISGKQAQTT
jgi:CMP-N,N'-diacetyllegionaminic acid synthase